MPVPSIQKNRLPTHWRGRLVGVILVVLVGKILLLPFGDGLARLSYDLPFAWQDRPTADVVLVYLDATTKKNLGQPPDRPLDRRFHTQLLNQLADEGAKLVLFDIIFDEPHPDPAVDAAFAAALHRHGRAVLIADYIKELNGNALTESTLPPATVLNAAAAGCGLARVLPDADGAIRRLDTGIEGFPSASWAAAQVLQSPIVKQERLAQRWLNYYCNPEDFQSIPLETALDPNGPPPGFFKDKIVCIGARPAVGQAGAAQDQFANPWTRLGGKIKRGGEAFTLSGKSSGVAVHAQSLLNLLQGDWLIRLGGVKENLVVLLWGIGVSMLLMRFGPWMAVGVAAAGAASFAVVAAFLQLHYHIWFAWVIPAGVQTAVALVWAVGYKYAVEKHRRDQLRRAFGAYLSPYMVDQIANSQFDLAPGGHETEASVMFTDLEGFTQMAESLTPAEISKILTAYFNHATRAILKEDGTIIKFIGDAVLAVWGAPMPEKNHAQRAVLAAWGMSQAGREEIHGRVLRTRIGVNTGTVLAGNLGSDFRFDYTVIGDTVNFAARLESLNKQLGTDILISESTAKQLDGSIKLRSLGRFQVAGKQNAIGIFEVLGPAENFPADPPWLAAFECARDSYVNRDFATAEARLHEVIALRGGQDGPASFFLRQINRARNLPAAQAWDGTVKLDAK